MKSKDEFRWYKSYLRMEKIENILKDCFEFVDDRGNVVSNVRQMNKDGRMYEIRIKNRS
jgi:hypothetical protein